MHIIPRQPSRRDGVFRFFFTFLGELLAKITHTHAGRSMEKAAGTFALADSVYTAASVTMECFGSLDPFWPREEEEDGMPWGDGVHITVSSASSGFGATWFCDVDCMFWCSDTGIRTNTKIRECIFTLDLLPAQVIARFYGSCCWFLWIAARIPAH